MAEDGGKMMVKWRNQVRKSPRKKARHSPTTSLIRKYNIERGLKVDQMEEIMTLSIVTTELWIQLSKTFPGFLE